MLSMIAPFHAHPFDVLDAMMSDSLLARRDVLTRIDAHQQPRLTDTGAAYAVALAAPGVAPSDLSIEVAHDNRSVNIKGETKTTTGCQNGTHIHSINLTLTLPDDADADGASATSVDGLLTLTLPKKAAAEPVSIAVSTEVPMDDESEGAADAEARPYKITLVAAGLAPADLTITAEASNVMTATGATKRTGAQLHRRFKLPRDADAPHATATCVDGILTIAVPKKAEAAPKTLVVNAPAAPPPSPAPQEKMADKEDEDEDAVMV